MVKEKIKQIIDRNTEGNYLLSSTDKAQIVSEILDLVGVTDTMKQSTDKTKLPKHVVIDSEAFKCDKCKDTGIYFFSDRVPEICECQSEVAVCPYDRDPKNCIRKADTCFKCLPIK